MNALMQSCGKLVLAPVTRMLTLCMLLDPDCNADTLKVILLLTVSTLVIAGRLVGKLVTITRIPTMNPFVSPTTTVGLPEVITTVVVGR
jgi:hypothetical protein